MMHGYYVTMSDGTVLQLYAVDEDDASATAREQMPHGEVVEIDEVFDVDPPSDDEFDGNYIEED